MLRLTNESRGIRKMREMEERTTKKYTLFRTIID